VLLSHTAVGKWLGKEWWGQQSIKLMNGLTRGVGWVVEETESKNRGIRIRNREREKKERKREQGLHQAKACARLRLIKKESRKHLICTRQGGGAIGLGLPRIAKLVYTPPPLQL
jgi:hypothetical protein